MCLLPLLSQAQIRVLSNGGLQMNNSFWTGGVNLHPVNFGGVTTPSIYPASPWYLTLGTHYNFIAGSYVHHTWSAIYDTWPSDNRLKINVKGIDNAVEKVIKLRPVSYDIIPTIYDSVQGPMRDLLLQDSKDRLGFIAQEYKEVFPQSVHKEPGTGYYGISMMDLIPVLAQAIKEQQVMIESLYDSLNKHKEKSLVSVKNEVISEKEVWSMCKLEQNVPNPFSESTEIRYFITEEIKEARIYIYDLQGGQIKGFVINQKGSGSIYIHAHELPAGMYFYTLLVDGKEISTKKMIITE